MNFSHFLIVVALAVGALQPADAQDSLAPGNPPVAFTTDVQHAELPPSPDGYVWHRLSSIQAAVITPVGWNRYEKAGANSRVIAFSPQALDQNKQFDVGFTARLLWHPQLRSGVESRSAMAVLESIAQGIQSKKADNKVLRGTLEDRSNKKMLIVRHRNAPANLPPIVVHTVAIGDPLTGLVYEFIFESPESSWDDNWKIAEPMFRRILILFQRG